MDAAWQSLAENGPWALVAGFLLWQVIQAWTADRKQLAALMSEFKDALVGLRDAVEDLRGDLKGRGVGE